MVVTAKRKKRQEERPGVGHATVDQAPRKALTSKMAFDLKERAEGQTLQPSR